MPRPDVGAHGWTFIEICIVILVMALVGGIAVRIAGGLGASGTSQTRSAVAQAGFTHLCEYLQRDVAGPLSAPPTVGTNLLAVLPSAAGGTVTYRLAPSGQAVTRTEASGKSHAFPFAEGPRERGSFTVDLRPGTTAGTHLLTFRLCPRADDPNVSHERAFPIRWQDLSRGFFQDAPSDRP